MASRLILFTDIETTGHDPQKRVDGEIKTWHEIIDLAGVLVNPATLEVVAEFETKVRPEHPERCLPNLVNRYPERAAKGEWQNARSLACALSEFLTFAIQAQVGRESNPPPVLWGENFFFDWGFFLAGFVACGIEEMSWSRYIHYKKFDAASMVVQELRVPGTPFDPDDWSMRTGEIFKKLGLAPEPKVRDAINGARKAFEVFSALEKLKMARFAKK